MISSTIWRPLRSVNLQCTVEERGSIPCTCVESTLSFTSSTVAQLESI